MDSDDDTFSEDVSSRSNILPPTPSKRNNKSLLVQGKREDELEEDKFSFSSSLTECSFDINNCKLGNCTECGQRITNLADACEAMGCIYHNACFFCCCCRRPLRGKTFYKDQSKVYCEEDYLYCGFQRIAEKCVICGHIITELILQALGQSYHPGCFRCVVCNESMDESPFTVDDNGAIYCLKDYGLVHGPRCAKCGMPILPESQPNSDSNRENSDEIKRICALDKEFHLECFRCEDCNIKLGDYSSSSTACYPLFETSTTNSLTTPTIHLLCLTCHINRIGATPAAGQDFKSSPNSASSQHFKFSNHNNKWK